VSAIRLNATTVQNVVTYNTVIDFENPDGRLLPGETAYATIPTGEVANVIKIPNAAIRFTPNLSADTLKELYRQHEIPLAATSSHAGGSQVVWVVEPSGKLRPVPLRVGITDYTFTQLLSGDVRVGDALVTGEAVAGENTAAAPPRFGGPRR
jgi:HlyD family secretion protein